MKGKLAFRWCHEYDFLKIRVWDVGRKSSHWDVVMSSNRMFQTRNPATAKARLTTVESPTGGTSRWLMPAERNVRRSGRSATGTSESKYRGALPWKTLYVSTATLYSIHARTRSKTAKSGSHTCGRWAVPPYSALTELTTHRQSPRHGNETRSNTEWKLDIWGKTQDESARRPKSDWGD